MFKKILIANRGVIACRIVRTLKSMGIASVAVYSDADRHSQHVADADEAIHIGPAPASESYLRVDAILDAARKTGAQAIHPGYGFLSENADFAQACSDAGLTFIGPTPAQMQAFGLKHTARELATANDVPLLPGSGLLANAEQAVAEAARIGYPVMLKSTAGGGGIGMQLVWREDELHAAFQSVERLAKSAFKSGGLFLEKYVEAARHIEVQIFGDGHGHVVSLGERDCSLQRRNQKVIEEAPAPGLSDKQRQQIASTAERLGRAISYQSAGTVEFVFDSTNSQFYFLEVNTRLQVEHGVTEEITGIDLVEWMVRQAAGELDLSNFQATFQGHSIQARIYAEDPGKNFQPCSGLLTAVTFPNNARVETWVTNGSEVSPYYDPMIGKVIVKADTREQAIEKLGAALNATHLAGIETNVPYLRQIAATETFSAGQQTTRYLSTLKYAARSIEVLEPGIQTTVQDYPGRVGYWHVGMPPSGPMDALAMRLANRLVGNSDGAAALEITLSGPTLKFNCDAFIVIAGAAFDIQLNGNEVAAWQRHSVNAGDVLKIAGVSGAGARCYLTIAGAIQVPDYLGSKATFTLGQVGGHGGRTLRAGDVLHVGNGSTKQAVNIDASAIPRYDTNWTIGVLYGPHGAPDFFTDADIETFFATDWEVHYNSSRTGVRLIGPKPQWARRDGGEAGLHPSNIHDNAYAIGAIDFTGDMPVILGPDGPSLGGFVCPAVVVKGELWKVGQLKPGDKVRFERLSLQQALSLAANQEFLVENLTAIDTKKSALLERTEDDAIIHRLGNIRDNVGVTYRIAGDDYLLIEYGPLVLDLNLRFRVHALMEALQAQNIRDIIDLTPGIRSLQVHYDSARLPLTTLMDILLREEASLPAIHDMEVPTRIVHLPLAWNDSQTQLAIQKYTQSVRKDAPWCPSNIEFIRRINGLSSIDEVQRIVFDASYLVLGLGDVYLGAPVATPIDPRHRLVTTKYNPARTWTPENAVGIGGAYMCIYGMEGPGGYQFVGRTIQMWNRHRSTVDFREGKPWLLRFFDQIRFYPVSEKALLDMRQDFLHGKFNIKIEEETFSLRDYNAFLATNGPEISRFKTQQQIAFEAERERWKAAGQADFAGDNVTEPAPANELTLAPGARAIASPVAGSIWKVLVKPGERISAGSPLMIIESMKMEINVTAFEDGVVQQILCSEGAPVAAGQNLIVIGQNP
jgi:urea carboxylase